MGESTATAPRPRDAEHAAPLVRLDHVDKHFGPLHVLRDVELDVHAGQVVVVVGPSGSGKSTLCRTINGLERVDSGRVLFDGRPLPVEGRELAKVRADIGMVFQSFNLFAHLTARDNVALGPTKVLGLSKAEARERAVALLERVDLGDKAGALPAELSGGQQQRVAIARALAMQPKLVLFDEPTSALDPEFIREVLDVMRSLAADGMTMLVVTHEMGFARSAADRIVFMDHGSVLEDTPTEEFFAEPRTDRARTFLATILSH